MKANTINKKRASGSAEYMTQSRMNFAVKAESWD